VNRLAAGRWLLAAGDTAQAARLLAVYNVDLPGTLHPLPAASVVLGVHMLPELARIEEAHEHAERAQRYRTLFRERADLLPAGTIASASRRE